MPLENLLCGQMELAKLCEERPLDWFEYAHMNEFHGNAGILKRYAGLPQDMPLPFAVEHAIPYDFETAYEYDLNSGLTTFLAVNEKSAAVYKSSGMKNVHVIGATYHYAMELFDSLYPQKKQPQRSGTIVFPDKSTLLMDTDFDRKAFARRLKELPAEFQPVVVCVYWRDYIRGNHLPYVEEGLPVVSAGHVRDFSFLLRQHDLCRRFKYSCANDISGSFTLSILSGCHFFYLDSGPLTQKKYGETKKFDRDPTMEKPEKRECLLSAPFPPEDPTKQRELARHHSGIVHKKSQAQLKELYFQAQRQLTAPTGPGTLYFGEKIERQAFYGLLPVGIDWDGWGRKETKLHLPKGCGVRALKLHMLLGLDPGNTLKSLRVYLNKKLVTTIKPDPIHQGVVLTCNCARKEAAFELVAEADFPIPGEKRHRSFRIEVLELLEKRPRQKRKRLGLFKKKKERSHAV